MRGLRQTWSAMVMKRPERHVHMPPPAYQEDVVGEGAEEEAVGERDVSEGVGENDAVNEGVWGLERRVLNSHFGEDDDILIDSDYETEGDKNEEQVNEPGRVEEEIVRETNESSDEEEPDVVENDGDLEEHRESDVGEGDGHSHPVFNPTEIYDPIFELGMLFSNKSEFKKALQSHAIKSKRTLKFTKMTKEGLCCGAIDCEWKMHAIKVKGDETFQINLLCDHHSCQNFIHQAYRAKKVALKEIEGSPEWQYARLWDYADELRKTNPGSTVIVGTEQIDGMK
ncbi:UNVERIFIED_CONTAM: hypothetical protein Slati_3434000, partial [Sesamum latifolium]